MKSPLANHICKTSRILYGLSAGAFFALSCAIVALVSTYLYFPLAELSMDEKLIYGALWFLTALIAGFFVYWAVVLLGGCCAAPDSAWYKKAKKFADANLKDPYWQEQKKDIFIPILLVTALGVGLRKLFRR